MSEAERLKRDLEAAQRSYMNAQAERRVVVASLKEQGIKIKDLEPTVEALEAEARELDKKSDKLLKSVRAKLDQVK